MLLLILSLAPLIFALATRYRKGLRNLPGPFFASFLPFDRLLSAFSGRQFDTHLKYHEKYGPIVRVGPNHVSFSNADSEFYSVFDIKTKTGVIQSIFSVRDMNIHKALKRPVANAYSMSALRELEPLVDACIAILEDKLDGMQNKPINFGTWLHWFAFDVISAVSFSERLGFMENEEDIAGIIEAIEGRLAYTSVVAQVPYLHQFLLGNSYVASVANRFRAVSKLNSTGYIMHFAAKQLKKYNDNAASHDGTRDMLARFKFSKDGDHPMSDVQMLSQTAGADTTASSLRAIVYYLGKNRRCYDALVREIDTAHANGDLSDPITFDEASKLPYLQACIKEALRLLPAVGQLLERAVPDPGATVGGVWLPAGTVVGVNPWVACRDKSVYGKDCNEFRPERWLEADPAQLLLMDRSFLAFGHGARACLGKNISMLEMIKLVPQLYRRYDIRLENPDEDWVVTCYWFVRQSNIICRVTKRQSKSLGL